MNRYSYRVLLEEQRVELTEFARARAVVVTPRAKVEEARRPLLRIRTALLGKLLKPALHEPEEREAVREHDELPGALGALSQEGERRHEGVAVEARDGVVDHHETVREIEGLVLERLEEIEERDGRALALAEVRDRLTVASCR
ncbi:MAG: hypothetical protein U0353_04130 [Sandaracinus sp.]